jgi:hypothetical protein
MTTKKSTQKKKAPQKRQVAKVKLLETFNLGRNTGKDAGAEITVFGKGGAPQLGTIKIGSGSIEWWPTRAKKKHLHLDWSDFSRLMNEELERR